jgi:hypothetical protein
MLSMRRSIPPAAAVVLATDLATILDEETLRMLSQRWAVVALALLAGQVNSGSSGGTISGTVVVDTLSIPGIGLSGPNSVVTGSYAYDASSLEPDGFGTVNPFTSFSLSIGTNPRVFTLADLITSGGNPAPPGRIVMPLFNRPGSTPTLDQLGFFFQQQDLSSFLGVPLSDEEDLAFGMQSYSVNIVVNAIPVPVFQIDFAAIPTPAAAVPEPGGMTLVGIAGVVSGLRAWRRRRSARAAA